MLRIGLTGTENSHVQQFLRYLNHEERFKGARAVAIMGPDEDRNADLAHEYDVPQVVPSPHDLLGSIDAAIVCDRDGADHRDVAEPLIRAGLPVLIDKPLATNLSDARHLIETAETAGSVLMSSSALRFLPAVSEFAPDHGASDLRHLHVIGPADPDSPYSGLFFYGIHHVEVALEILGNPLLDPDLLDVHVRRVGDCVVATTWIDSVALTFSFIVPESNAPVPFAVTGVCAAAVHALELPLTGNYNLTVLDRFLRAAGSGTWPMTGAQMLAPVALASAIVAELEAGGTQR